MHMMTMSNASNSFGFSDMRRQQEHDSDNNAKPNESTLRSRAFDHALVFFVFLT